jgi:hypothetical protein
MLSINFDWMLQLFQVRRGMFDLHWCVVHSIYENQPAVNDTTYAVGILRLAGRSF